MSVNHVNDPYYAKYLKYKTKYLELQEIMGGAPPKNGYAIDFLFITPEKKIGVYKAADGMYKLPGWAIQNIDKVVKAKKNTQMTGEEILGLTINPEMNESIGAIIPEGGKICMTAPKNNKLYDTDNNGKERAPILISVSVSNEIPNIKIKHLGDEGFTLEWKSKIQINELNTKKQIYQNHYNKMIQSCA
jgi:hypothetical protein